MVVVKQLELDLWTILQAASSDPVTAEFSPIWLALDQVLPNLAIVEQLLLLGGYGLSREEGETEFYSSIDIFCLETMYCFESELENTALAIAAILNQISADLSRS
jgi:hypothetical protein